MPASRYAVAVDQHVDESLSHDLVELEVTEGLEAPSRFVVRFVVDACEGGVQHVDDERLLPDREGGLLSVLVDVEGTLHCLAHGPITERRIVLRRGIAGSTLELEGRDRSVLLDRVEAASVATELALDHGQATRELLGSVFSSVDVRDTDRARSERDHPVRPTGSVLSVLRQIVGLHGVRMRVGAVATRAGDRIRVTDTAIVAAMPPRSDGDAPVSLVPTSARRSLHVSGDDTCRALDGFEIQERGEARNRGVTLSGIDLRRPAEARTGGVERTAERPLGGASVGGGSTSRVATPPLRAGSLEERQAALQSALDDDAWFISARAETSVDSFGDVVRPTDVVDVRGAGRLYSGPYYVRGVVHRVDRSGHRMTLDLMRNARGGE